MIYTKLTLERDAPSQAFAGNVILRIRDLEQREVVVSMTVADWSRALLLHKPITAWVTSGHQPKELIA